MGSEAASEPKPPTPLQQAVEALGPGPLTQQAIAAHLRPLFARTLSPRSAANPHIYLATHSLGRPLDAVEDDLREGLALWQRALTQAWEPWLDERENYRSQLAALIGAPAANNVVPRASAAQALRAVLNMLPPAARVLSTTGEFDSVSMLLGQYASLGRIELELVAGHRPEDPADPLQEIDEEWFECSALAHQVQRAAAAGRPFALAVVSQVFFATGQLLGGLEELARTCHQVGTRLLVDSYHALGVVLVDVLAMGCDYLIGGCYKYLRGGPGAAFLYLSPQVLASNPRPLDTGWFALQSGPQQPGEAPRLADGGDAYLEGTPAVLSWYQARSGLAFTRAVGVERLRAYGLAQLRRLQELLAERGIQATGGDHQHGAFLTLAAPDAADVAMALARDGIVVSGRGNRLRICPDCLTADEELGIAAEALARQRRMLQR